MPINPVEIEKYKLANQSDKFKFTKTAHNTRLKVIWIQQMTHTCLFLSSVMGTILIFLRPIAVF